METEQTSSKLHPKGLYKDTENTPNKIIWTFKWQQSFVNDLHHALVYLLYDVWWNVLLWCFVLYYSLRWFFFVTRLCYYNGLIVYTTIMVWVQFHKFYIFPFHMNYQTFQLHQIRYIIFKNKTKIFYLRQWTLQVVILKLRLVRQFYWIVLSHSLNLKRRENAIINTEVQHSNSGKHLKTTSINFNTAQQK